jgi:hypothetical protein
MTTPSFSTVVVQALVPYNLELTGFPLCSTFRPHVSANPKLRSLPPLPIPMPNVFASLDKEEEADLEAPSSESPSPSAHRIERFSFEAIAIVICTYRIALLNFESSSGDEIGANGKALGETVKTIHKIIDDYDNLSELSRQLVGVFLKELYFESQSTSHLNKE